MEELPSMSIKRVQIDDCELIDSRVINLFKDSFMVVVENVIFRFEFIDDPNEDALMVVTKKGIDEETGHWVYKANIYNFNNGKVQGRFTPMEFGKDEDAFYHYSITGIAKEGSETEKIVVFNLLREPVKKKVFE